MDNVTPIRSSNSFQNEVEGLEYTTGNPGTNPQRFGKFLLSLLVFGSFFLLPSIQGTLYGQSTTCVPPAMNGNGAPWSEECYLKADCSLQGNPCTSNDVKILSIYLADEFGNPIPPCIIGDPQTVLVWGVFNNSTGTSRYAIRTRTEAWLNGMFASEFNACSFDVLVSGQTAVALLGEIDMTCGDELQLLNTWISWNTSASQCEDPMGTNYAYQCNDYSPSKCFKNLAFINFLTPTFSFACQSQSPTMTNVCFTSSVFGGTPPYTYAWNFGDTGMSTAQNPCHSFSNANSPYVVTLTVTDSDSISQSFAVSDTVDLDVLPCINQTMVTATCLPPASPVACPDTLVFPIPMVVTDCPDTVVTITYSDVTTPGACPGDYSVTRTWLATDNCGDSGSCSVSGVVEDVLPPIITCVAQTTPINCPAVPAFNPPTVSDACDGTVSLTFSDATTPGACTGTFSVTRTWTATDDCLNSATCSSTIVVQDNTPPTITCVTQTTPILCPATPVFTPPTATDACDATVAITFSDVTTPGVCPILFSVTRTWTATDDCGNTATCSRTIAVQDLTPPTITCVAQTTPINCPATPVFTPPTATDACDATVAITFSDATTPGTCAGTFSVTRTWTATDDCANTSTCSRTIVVQDVTPPTITCVAQTTPVNCPAAPVFTPPTVSDACDGTVTLTFSDVTTPGSCPGNFSVTRTWTATDDCGGTATCSATIVSQDNTPPTITCVTQVTPINCPATPVFTPPTATDACDPTVVITFSDVSTPGACTGTYSTTRTWTATDDCGNTATCSRTIVVQDVTPPTITCVAQTTPINCPATPVFTPPTATDACDLTVAITFSDVSTPGACTGTYSTTRTWTATDDCGNSATCSRTIVVQDVTPPTITCVAQTTPINCPATPVFTPPTATDACDATVAITFSDASTPGSCTGTYSTTRTWTATDDCGNTATCSRTIVVQDVTPPTITCVAQTSPIDCLSAPVFTPPTATDACDATVAITFSDVTTPGVCPELASVTRTWTATDDCGNTATCSGTIVMLDAQGPTITCPADATISCEESTLVADLGNATATDVCDPTVTIESFDYFGTPPTTAPEMRWVPLPAGTVSGSCSSGSDCATGVICFGLLYTPGVTGMLTSYTTGFFVDCDGANSIVLSNTSCVMTDNSGESACAGGSLLMNSSGNTGALPITQNVPVYIHQICLQLGPGASILLDEDEPTDLTTSVNLPGDGTATETPSFTNYTAEFDVICAETCIFPSNIYRLFVATDDCGNQSTCIQQITIQDVTPPTLTCVAQTTPLSCPNTPVFAPPTVSDNCDLTVTLTFADVTTPGTCSANYSVTRTWTATDDCLNSSTCSATIVVQDVTPPTITCAVSQTTPIACPATPVFTPPTATDACDLTVVITFSDVSTPGTCTGTYSTTRTWTATDDCGNTATCSAAIVVQDVTPPTITCALTQTTPIACPATPVFTPPTATDACDLTVVITFSDLSTPGTCTGTYSTTRTWTATDDCGNTATCSATIVVQDLIPPTLTCVAQTTPIACPATPVFTPPTVSDACDGTVVLTFTDVSTPGTCTGTYSTTRTWTATDDCGNTATCSSTIVVQDVTPPTITCAVSQTTPIACPATPVFTPPTATDACDLTVVITFSDVSTPGTCIGTYSTTRTWTATDDCGNTATCSGTIVVQDVTPPTITCAVSQTTPIACPATPVFTPPTATDACDLTVVITFSDVSTPGTCIGTYSTTRTWTATDDCGNTATCSGTIVVQDVTPPTITCAVSQTTPIACPATPVFTPPTATDACDLTVVITFSDVSTPGTCTGTYSTTRTWTATDDCGNTATCSATIVVQDVTPPTITCAVSQTTPIACPATPVFTPPTATDACDLTVVVTFSDVSTPGTCTGTYSTTRTWTATDDCGNTATCSATIVVQDVTPPTITCALTQTTPIACPATPVFTPPTATDACDLTVVITFSDVSTPGTCTGTYSTTRTWTATDDCGNTATCSATIVVQDVTPPTITCALTQTTPIACPATPVFTPPTATDACDLTVVITFSDVSTPGTCTGTYSTTRTWTATDDCGNTATCSATIVVQDVTPPTITCALTQTTPIACPATPVFTPPTATDACDLTVVITFSDVSTPGTCTGTYSTTRTWTATDDCGNTATCSATIVVQDVTPPTITCAVSQTTPIACPATPVFTPPTATDACDLTVVITFSDVSTPGTCTGTYSTTRTWTATDDCGNTATCSATIVVQDVTPPTITCAVSQTTPIACPATPVFTPPTATDACDLTVVVTFSDVSTPGTCTGTYSTTRTWTATDDCGNTATCSATIVVQDITPPTITCVAQTTPIACPATPVFTPPTATDACDLTVVITFSDVTTPGTCSANYSVTRTWTATDDCGNTATCSGTIVVQDITPPTITCAVSQTTPIACPATPVFTPPTATDACDLTVVITFSDVTTPGTCSANYSVTRTWTATDDCGNTATCSGTIVVQDITPPTITCALTQTTPIACPATPVFTPPTATDACDLTVVITFSDVSTPGTCTGTYSTTRTWTATDDCGNTATCSATIVVQDITPPTITCAVTQTTPIACPATPVFTPPTATDACDLTVVITFSDVSTPGTCTGTYSTTRTWTATDDCGNTATCSATIVVQDITPPTITCATQVTPIACPALPAFLPPTATDACDLTVTVTFSDVSTPGTCIGTYSTTRTWTATDDCGNTATCSGTIVVQDITPPTITCVAQTSPIACPATPVFTPPTATDACDLTVVITFSDVSTPGTCTGTYSTTRTWTATDDCGNTATCSGTIVVQDITPPTITCVAQTSPIACPATPVFTPPTATDACDLTVAITFSDLTTPGTCTGTYSVRRTWTATDDCGNTATCSGTIVVQDITPPTITCALTQTTPIACPATPVFTPPTATDACDLTVAITFSDISTPGTCTGTYSTTRTWTATDDCGNTATCSATIVVQDITPPTITCVAQTSPIACPATPVFTPPTATDACDLTVTITFSDVSTPGTCTGTYSTTRTWTATDDCGNTATCSGTIVVQDITPPTITCATQVTPIACPALPTFLPPTATDACDLTVVVTFSDVSTPGTCLGTYSTTRTWTATDDCGNTATCSGTIVVQDITPPMITCPPSITIECSASTAPGGTNGVATATDLCDATPTITSTDVVIPSTVCAQESTIMRTWRATDDCGNSSTCVQTIFRDDSTPPVIQCPPNITVGCWNDVPDDNTGLVMGTDNCSPTIIVTHVEDQITNMGCINRFTVVRVYRATDLCGNSSTCTQVIVVNDVIPPTIVCPMNITVQCAADVPPQNIELVGATDNCGLGLTIKTWDGDVISNQTCANRYTVTRTYRATDACGNSATCAQIITVFDSTPPTITCVAQTTPIACPALPTFIPPTATDNCVGSVTLTFSDATTPGTCTGTYSTTRTWTATDVCGNTATCSGTIVVQDITPPTITCVAQTSPIACPATPVFTPPTATDACDLTVAITFSDVSTPGTCTGTYSTTRTWTATDDCGNTATCSGTIVVQDITPPTITCVTQTSPIACPALPAFLPPTATDACDLTVAITFSDVSTPGTCTGTYSTTRTWTATDDCGNTATCSGTIVVQDITPPTITCATQVSPVACPALPTFLPPTATDACDLTVTVTFSDVSTPGTCTGTYSTTRTWTATDDCGNTATCSGTIVVQDITPPTITCATQVTPIACPALPTFLPPTATDACDLTVVVTFSDVSTPGTCTGTYSTTRTWTATDDCGNTATCSSTIVVQDITPPTITCVAQTSPIACPATPVFTPPTATDACDLTVSITFSDVSTPGTCTGTYSTTRTWTATDDCGNTATCSGTIVVQDITPPTITCVTQTSPINCPATPVFTPPTATDACDLTVAITFSDLTTPGTCTGTYSVRRTWTATDDCGNTATCSGTIVVQDITPPTITCVTQTSPIACPALPAFLPPTATDACDLTVAITFSDVSTPGTCTGTYSTTRTWTATDDCGNTATCSGTIVVQDITPPTITCATQVTPIACPALPAFLPPTATDACDLTVTVTFSDVSTPGTCTGTYSTTRTWTATDDCGNTATCSGTIVVQDITPPTITCAVQTTPINCPAVPTFLPPTATDACDLSVTLTFADLSTPGTCTGTYSVRRTWTATDDCGNTATCSSTIVVQDITPPTITCVAQTSPIACPATPVFLPPTATDACDATVAITFSDLSTPGTCVGTYSVRRTWTATDDCGNTATCSGTIVVQDITPPTITCVAQTSPIACPATPVFIPPTATDACDLTVAITFSDLSTPGTCVGTYSVRRTWTATDDCGNTATCSGTIVVQDITPPTITCVTQTSPINCPATPVFTPPTATDACDLTVAITFSDLSTPGTCTGTYSVRRTWTATDDCGNTATCSGTIVVQDITPPTITCATQNSPTACMVTPVFIPPTATDACDATVAVTFSDVTTPGSCPGNISVTRTWTATDDCGNTATCSGTIVVQDITPPTITCVAQTSPINCPATPVFTPPTATDACDPSVAITFSDLSTPGTCTGTYSVRRTWTATDDCGNTATCSGTVVVQDITPPTITCVAQTSPITCPALPVFTPPTATDACDVSVAITFSDLTTPGTCVGSYSVRRTWTATDDCGNTATCSGTVVVQDITPPSITCPIGVTVTCAASQPPANIAGVTTSDACDPAPIVTFVSDVTVNQTCFNRYMVNRTYRSTDACGNSATCIQVITVFDNVPPTITCPAAITVQCAALVPVPNIATVTTSDNCTGPAPVVTFVSDVTTNQTCVNRYTLTRTYRSTDACGNSATCAQVITVFDNTPPTITCPVNITVQCANLVPVPSPATVVTSDNCAGTPPVVTFVSDVTTNQTCINRYTLTRTYRSTDACGNSATCTQVITVFDNTPPVITPVNPILVGVPNNGTLEVQCFGQDPNWNLPTFGPADVTASDNCTGTVVQTFDDVLIDEGNCPVDGYINRYRLRWTATDACGNSASYTVFLNLIDTIPPVILGVPEDITVNCDEVPDPPIMLTALDECLCACVVEMEQDGPNPGCQDGQIITRTWEATDYCGNVTIAQQHITLVDDEGPVMTIEEPSELAGLPNGTVLEFTCNEGGIPAYFDELNVGSVSSPLVCGGLPTITFDQNLINSINCERFGYITERTFTWTGVDACGNVNTMTITAHLVDTEDPTIVGVPDMTCIGDPALDLVEAVDNCEKAGLIFWDVKIPSPCGDGEALFRTYEAQDQCGNFARDTVTLIPNDGVPPTMEFVNPDLIGLGEGEYISVECDVDGEFFTPWGLDDVTISDDCPGATLEFEQTIMQVYDGCEDGALFWLQLTWTASDLCGNTDSLFLYVYIKDETPPVFDAYSPVVTIDCNDEWPVISATDNCNEVVITSVDNVIATDCIYEYDVIRTLTATDLCGNFATATQTLHVGDHSGPDITGVDTLVCDDLTLPNVTAFDPCANQNVPVTLTEVNVVSDCGGRVIERTWSATDICGNVATVTQRIILDDTMPPLILVPTWSIIRKFQDNDHNFIRLSDRDVIKQLNDLDESSVFSFDLCDGEIVPVFTVDITLSQNCLTDGWWQHRVYTWVSTDVCGNSTVLTFEVDILDDVAPGFFAVPGNTEVICGDLPDPPTVLANDDSGDIIAEFFQTITEIPGQPGHYRVIRTWTAIDPCGNRSVATQSILWIPDTFVDCEIILPPVVDCNSHGVIITSDVGGGIPPFTYVWDVIGQECFIQTGQGTPTITIYVGFFDVTISLTVTDAFGCQSVCTAVLECFDPLDQFTGSNPTGQTQANSNNPNNTVQGSNQDYLRELNYWPNPANTMFNISFDAAVERDVEINFINFLGEVVLTDHLKAHVGTNTRKIDVTKLPEGTYLFQVKTDKEIHAKGIVIMR